MSAASSAAAARSLEHTHSPAVFRSSSGRTLVFCLLLVGATIAFYNPVIHNGFLNYDDDGYILENAHVRSGLSWTTVKWAFTTYDKANYHPLTWLSHALDCQLFGVNPAGHHYVSVLIHALNAALLFLLLQSATGFRWRSLMVAALFALHPINVESVVWAAERKSVLSMLFFLLALYAYGWYARRPTVGRYCAVPFFYALALLAKPSVITFPCLLFLWDYWPLGRIGGPVTAGPDADRASYPSIRKRWIVLEKLPLFALTAASAVITMQAQKAGGAVKPLSHYGVLLRMETAVVAYVRYLGKALWPVNLAALYPHPSQLYPAWEAGGALLLLIAITILVLLGRNRRYLATGWFWYLGSMVPMIGLIQVGFGEMADRHSYLPFIGIYVMVIWLIADLIPRGELPSRWLAATAVGYLLVLGMMTYRQIGYWRDIPTFWRHTLALTSGNYVAEDNFADFLQSEGKKDEAADHYRAALAIYPDDLPANLNLGNYEYGRGDFPAAIAHYDLVVREAAKIDNFAGVSIGATAYSNLGTIYRRTGDWVKAKQNFEMALQLVPERTTAMIGLGLIAEKKGDMAEAVRQYAHAMSLQSTDIGLILLAHALQEEGKAGEAQATYAQAVRFSQNLPAAQQAAETLLLGK